MALRPESPRRNRDRSALPLNPSLEEPMHKLALPAVLTLVALFAFPISRAQALNQRSWVATTGSGSTCVRPSPCANFVTALAATNPGGEINCVDTGDFGNGNGLFIDRSITIDCEGVQGS